MSSISPQETSQEEQQAVLAAIEEEIEFAQVCFQCNQFAWECSCNFTKETQKRQRAERRLQWELRRKRAECAIAMADRRTARLEAALTLGKMRAEKKAKIIAVVRSGKSYARKSVFQPGDRFNPIELSSDEEELFSQPYQRQGLESYGTDETEEM